ncbi:MAG TPA: hypothetical protein VK588_16145 [Chitinophagaceae bacterium]|nr:hypothetical protein [Chitinophagaceae bacterium]
MAGFSDYSGDPVFILKMGVVDMGAIIIFNNYFSASLPDSFYL